MSAMTSAFEVKDRSLLVELRKTTVAYPFQRRKVCCDTPEQQANNEKERRVTKRVNGATECGKVTRSVAGSFRRQTRNTE